MIVALMKHYWLKRLISRGLQIADDCRMVDRPNFGSEPYLISIGKHVTISGGVSFITHDGGSWVFRGRERYGNVIKYGRITVHDNCFIGYRSILMPGISIGPNSVVASGAVVTRDVHPNNVYGGVPAKFICSVEDYAERSLQKTPEYDLGAYKADKVKELLRLYPRPW